MQQYLILIRHSISAPAPNLPAHEWPLTDNGKLLCHPLAQKLAEYSPDRMLTSSEPKAVQTGQLTADKLSIPAHTFPGLHEHERADVPWFDNADTFKALVARLFTEPDTLVFGQETAQQALVRFSTAVGNVLKTYPAQTLAIVTHGTVMSLFIAQHNPIDPIIFWQTLRMPAFAVLTLPDFGLHQLVNSMD